MPKFLQKREETNPFAFMRRITDELDRAFGPGPEFPELPQFYTRAWVPAVEIFEDVYQMAEGCDALVVVTEWNEFQHLDLEKVKSLLRTPVIYDGRNIYDPVLMSEMGFVYRAIGRGMMLSSLIS